MKYIAVHKPSSLLPTMEKLLVRVIKIIGVAYNYTYCTKIGSSVLLIMKRITILLLRK